MKIYISTDIEGLAGVTNWDMENSDTAEFRKLYNEQVAWVIEGIQKSSMNAQVEQILIADSHARGNNLRYDYLSDLDDRIYLINGYPRKNYMMCGFDETFDQIFFVGYHSGIGKETGNMDHSYSARSAYKVWINDQPQNETTINAAFAAEFGVPVTLVTGDSALGDELVGDKQLPDIQFVETKKSISRYAAMSYPKTKVRHDTHKAVQEVLANSSAYSEVHKFDEPLTLKLQLATTAKADVVAQMQNVKRIDGRTIAVECSSMQELMGELLAIVAISGTQD